MLCNGKFDIIRSYLLSIQLFDLLLLFLSMVITIA